MSDRRHAPRPTLPEGYQYGDARPRILPKLTEIQIDGLHPTNPITGAVITEYLQWFMVTRDQIGQIDPMALHPLPPDLETPIPFARIRNPIGWRAPHENAAAQLKRQQRTGDETV